MVCRFYLCQLYRLFQLQQPLLGIRTIGKACELTIGSDYAVAGDDEEQRILVARHAYGAACAGVASRGSYLSIGAGCAIGDLLQGTPHTLLKGCAYRADGEIQLLAFPFEIGHYLLLSLAKQGSRRRGCINNIGQLNAGDSPTLFGETHYPDRAAEGVCHRGNLISQTEAMNLYLQEHLLPIHQP